MVGEFFRWWVEQLTDLLPAQLRFTSREPDGAVVMAAGPLTATLDAVLVSVRQRGRETQSTRCHLEADKLRALPPLAGKLAVLRLAAADVLAKTLVLPLAAERQLDQVVAFELDRETPFSPEELFWSCEVTGRDRRRGQLSVRLLLVPRAKLAALLRALEQAGIRPHRAEIADGPDRGRYLPLDLDAVGPQHLRRRVLRPLAACFAALVLIAAALPVARQAVALGGIEREIAKLRIAEAEARKLRQEIDRLVGSADLIKTERAAGGEPIAVLAALTRLLPPNTYLTDFVQQHGKVTLTGRSGGAAKLIARVAESQRLHNPNFAAPITKIAASQLEIFTITAEVRP